MDFKISGFETLKKIVIATIMISLIVLNVHETLGHGVGGESLPVSIGDRNATLAVSVQPPLFDPKDNESYLTIGLTEDKTGALIEQVTFDVTLFKDGKQIFKEKLYDDLGNITIKIISKNSEQITIDGKKEPINGGWSRTLSSPITMEGPIFTSGGLYKFHIEIITVDSVQNILFEKPMVNGAISIAEKNDYSVLAMDGKNYAFAITTYYDKLDNFKFDSKNFIISFEMPFDWSKANITQTSVVHQEIHIPKTFAEMLVTKYDATLNEIPLSESSITIDDYSENARIVHLILNQKNLLEMTDQTNKTKMLFYVMPSKQIHFPLLANTGNAQFQVGLSWNPPILYPDQISEFYVDFDELFSDKTPKLVSYDFVLKQNGKEIFRNHSTGMTNSPTKTNTEAFNFSSDTLGSIIVSIERINDNEYANANFVAVVKSPEKPKQTFPIRLASEVNDSGIIKEGSYFVDLTWIPSELSLQEESEFIFTIYDKQTLKSVRQAEYDFIILQNETTIFQKSNTAQSGGDFVDFRFSQANVGPATLRIEKINQSTEYIEIPIVITPEFPVSILVFLVILSLVCLLTNKIFPLVRVN